MGGPSTQTGGVDLKSFICGTDRASRVLGCSGSDFRLSGLQTDGRLRRQELHD